MNPESVDPDYKIPYRNHWDQRDWRSYTTITVSPGRPRRKRLAIIAWSLFAVLAFALIAIGGMK